MSSVNISREERLAHEIAHGKRILPNAGEIWGFTSSAGVVRARRRAQMLIDGAHVHSGMHVVECGCGTGLFTRLLTASGARITAVDISPDLLAVARQEVQDSSVTFVEGDVMRLDTLDTLSVPVDAIVGNGVLHHVDLRAVLLSMRRVLRPGAWIAFTEPNYVNPQVWLQKTIPCVRRWAGESPDETAFVRWQLVHDLEQHGFVDVTVTPFDFVHPGLPLRLVAFADRWTRRWERIPLVREISGSLYITARYV